MKLRSQLSMLAFVAIAPVLVLAIAVGVLLVRQDRHTMEEEAIGRTQSAMTAIDAEIRGHLATLLALAASRALEKGDVPAFYEDAGRVLRSQSGWLNVGLADAGGRQLFDAVRPLGDPAPLTGDLPSYQRAVESRRVVIGDVSAGAAVQQPSVRLRMPVLVDGVVRYVITVPLKTEGFAEVLRAQRLPDNWVIALVDRNRRFIARLPAMPPGTPVSPSFREAIERSPNGWFPGATLEGTRTYTPYVTSELTGWVLGIAIPARAVEAAATRTFVGLGIGTFVALAVALFLGWFMGRRISAPIAALAAATEAMGQGKDVEVVDTGRIDEITRLHAALRDAAAAVRERRELAEREQQALRATDRAKDEFLAMLSHELRNPLAALGAAAHVLKLAKPDAEAAIQARGVIDRQTRHMARLVGDLLDVSRVTMGKVALERERLNLADVIGRVSNTWRSSGRLERHRLEVKLEPAWVDADWARLEQVYSNLLDNAIKFTPAGKLISVRVALEGETALLQIADEGEGLAPEATTRMFDLFVQGERGLDRAQGGLGVGLALVKRLVELHGGTVTAESAGPGRGATFTVRLPAVPAGARTEPAEASLPRSAARQVLIIEDNEDTRAMMRAALALSGHDVREARDGASGLALAQERAPHVALVDIGLPDIDGYEVARRLRASPGGRGIGLVALTGYGQAEDQRRAFDAGFDVHLTKPVSASRLRQVIASLA